MGNDSDRPDVAMVTGANGAIGSAICRGIAETDGYEVVMLCRDESKARRVRDEIVEETGVEEVRYVIADVSRRKQVYELADDWEGPLDVLVNNAATTPRQREETPEGLERQFATNVMGYFWMTRAFAPILADSEPSRIVNVASYWAGGMDLDDLQFEDRPYDNDEGYRQSKQANRMLTVAFAEQFDDRGIRVNSCHPGDVPSRLAKNLGFHGNDTPAEAADTPVWLATTDAGLEHTGAYFRDRAQRRCRFSEDRDAVQQLFERCLQFDRE